MAALFQEDKRSSPFLLCKSCKANNLLDLARKRDDAFVSIGFCMWKRATEKFWVHEKSIAHLHALSQYAQLKGPTVIVSQLSSQKELTLELPSVRYFRL